LYSKYKALKVTFEKTKQEIETCPARSAQKASDDQICNLTVQRQQFEGLLRVSEEKLAHEQAKSQELLRKLERAEAELTELRCYLKVLATDERHVKKSGTERTGIIDELQNIGGKIDRVHRAVSEQRLLSPRRFRARRRPIQTWRRSGRL
jgi:chromosome segregation ATPase